MGGDNKRRALEARAAIRRAVRGYFEGEGFLEVETPMRVFNPGQEIHLDAIPADRVGGAGTPPGAPTQRWLITSPEYHMKRLVGAGHQRIFQLGRAFRAGERGPHHEPEFTMLEWYRAEPSLDAIARDCEHIIEAAARAVGSAPPAMPFPRTTVRALWRRHVGTELIVPRTPPAAWDESFFQVWLDRIEANLGGTLGRSQPLFVFDWPLPLGALARRHPQDRDVVERFELYAGGLELVNAFGELVDPIEQRARFEAESTVRRARGKPVYAIDDKLLDALGRMPPTCGAALGFDRLVMLVLGATQIRDIIAFADDEV